MGTLRWHCWVGCAVESFHQPLIEGAETCENAGEYAESIKQSFPPMADEDEEVNKENVAPA